MNYAWILLALPLLGFLVTGGVGRRLSRNVTGAIGSGVVGAAFVVAVIAFLQLHGQKPDARFHDVFYYTWLSAGTFHVDLGLLIDPLSAMMLLVVTGVGFLIHVYSIGYMAHDANFSRFFSYLNLFIFSMVLLVLADNFLILIIGWGMVGLSSYLLIGFWLDRPTAVLAARKAFVMNVIGDVGMMLAAFLMFEHFGTLSYNGVFSQAQHVPLGSGFITAIALLLLVGAVAKSAQIPLYTWLPDAMEGPTPVSALIHAATMVTAGVYLIARSYPVFHQSPISMALVAIVGAVGALYAASIALTQTDIKRVLAYSTISQIAYMFLGLGVGAFGAGMFHLMTHAFFKAVLFLGAGNVIHALADEQDLRKMGGLRSKLPVTYVMMFAACLAISGIFPFAGFFSKDQILGETFAAGGWYIILWIMGVITAGLTAFYMFRLFYLTFHGAPAGPPEVHEHAHEAPWVMLLPVSILGVLSVFGGWIQVPFGWGYIDDFLAPVFTRYPATHAALKPANANVFAVALALAVALAGWYVAYRMYAGVERRPFRGLKPVYELLLNKYFVDEIYDEIFVVPVRNGARVLYGLIDRAGIDGAVNGVARMVRGASAAVSPLETGYVRTYVLTVFIGVVLVALIPVLFGTIIH